MIYLSNFWCHQTHMACGRHTINRYSPVNPLPVWNRLSTTIPGSIIIEPNASVDAREDMPLMRPSANLGGNVAVGLLELSEIS